MFTHILEASSNKENLKQHFSTDFLISNAIISKYHLTKISLRLSIFLNSKQTVRKITFSKI